MCVHRKSNPAVFSVGMAVCATSDSAPTPPLPSVAGFAEPLRAPALSSFLKHVDGSSKWTLDEFEVGGGDAFVTNYFPLRSSIIDVLLRHDGVAFPLRSFIVDD